MISSQCVINPPYPDVTIVGHKNDNFFVACEFIPFSRDTFITKLAHVLTPPRSAHC